MVVLSSKYANGIVEALGFETMPPDHFMSVPRVEIDALSGPARRRLSIPERKRFELD